MVQDEAGCNLTEEQGQILVKVARQALCEHFGRRPASGDSPTRNAARAEDCLLRKRGTFVCLKIAGQLRGCIGNLLGEGALADDVERHALEAAFHDPRFSPLAAEELDRIKIEVSVLTVPQPLVYDNASDLLGRLRPSVDGVVIRRGFASATFLPQVWEQLPHPQQFLSHLCQKAGLPGDCWRKMHLQVLTYQVQYFTEQE